MGSKGAEESTRLDDWARFGAELRRMRKEAEVSLRKLSEIADVSPSYVSKVENGLMAPPSERVLRIMAPAVGVDSWELLRVAGKLPTELREALLALNGMDLRSLYQWLQESS